MLTFFQSSHKPFSASPRIQLCICQAQPEFSSCLRCADMRSWFPGNTFLRLCEASEHIIPQDLPLPSPSSSLGKVMGCVWGARQQLCLLQDKHPQLCCTSSRESKTASKEFRSVSLPIHWQPVQWDKPLITSQRSYVLRQQGSHRIIPIGKWLFDEY